MSHPQTDPDQAPAGASKNDLRCRGLAARDALSPEERARLSAAICARATTLPEVTAAATLMLFASFRSEIHTDRLIAWALGAGKVVCLPRILAPRRMAAFRVCDPAAELEPGTWGIPEPCAACELVDPQAVDAVLVPGAAFDPNGNRCGYGGGFYDNFLPLMRPHAARVALAFEAQIVDHLPCEPHDLPVTAIVTETRVIRPH
jgi:5-formyltetrahydrofolate cyclo-ligase